MSDGVWGEVECLTSRQKDNARRRAARAADGLPHRVVTHRVESSNKPGRPFTPSLIWSKEDVERMRVLKAGGKTPKLMMADFPAHTHRQINNRYKQLDQLTGYPGGHSGRSGFGGLNLHVGFSDTRPSPEAIAARDARLAADAMAHLDPNVALLGDPTPYRRQLLALSPEPAGAPFLISAVRRGDARLSETFMAIPRFG